jgi:hypothetical protein
MLCIYLKIINLLHNLLIVDYGIGHTGSVHDSWAFRSTRTFKEHENIFANGEWLWADSAYPCERWSVCPFKKAIGRDLTPDQRSYNYHVSKVSPLHIIAVRIEYSNTFSQGSHTFRTHNRTSEGHFSIPKRTSNSNQ